MPQFKVLGALEILAGGRSCTPGPPKIRSVLALLLLRPNRVVNVDSIMEELWGLESPRSAVTTVQTYIYQLRRMFGAEGLDPPGEQLIETRPAGYLIRAEPEQVDAEVFERLLRQGRALLEKDRASEAAMVLRRALDMWAGPALADVPRGSLLQAHAIKLEERRTNALELRIRADVKLGRHNELIAELRSLVQAYPLNEWFHEQLIAALSRCGRRGEALRAYQDVRALLIDELGVDPSLPLQRLQHQILSIGSPEPRASRQIRGSILAAPNKHLVKSGRL
jgi:SARP family transcriptional regulator, regulator of embCAB operon